MKQHKIQFLYKHLTIKQKIFTILTLLTSGLLAFSIISSQITNQVLKNEYFLVSSQSLNLFSSLIGNELQEINNLSLQVALDNEVQTYLDAIYTSQGNYGVSFEAMGKKVTSYINYKPYIDTVHIIDTASRESIFGPRRLPIDDEYVLAYSKMAAEASGKNIWLKSADDKHLLCIRAILNTDKFMFTHIGTLIMRIDKNLLLKEKTNYLLERNSPILIVFNNGNTIINSASDLPDQPVLLYDDLYNLIGLPQDSDQGYLIKTFNKDKYFISYLKDHTETFTYISLIPYNNVVRIQRIVAITSISVLLLLFVLLIFVSKRISDRVTMPIEELTKNMHLVKEGVYDLSKMIFTVYDSNDEIKDLQDTFKTMLQKIDYLINEIYEKQIIVEKTRFEALQAQINPHFLYNTLASINVLAKNANQNEISTMVISLSNLLRQSINFNTDLIYVYEELSLINDFVNIQKIRYPNRLDIVVNVEEHLQHLMIPKFSLQPLVENAIKYNISNKRGLCHISVSSFIEEEKLLFIVEDNGIGMNPYYLFLANPKIDPEHTGLGLKNINERIKMLFGESYGLSINSESNKGTRITVCVPLVSPKEDRYV